MKPSLRNTLTVALLCLLGAVGGYWTARLWLPGTHNTAQSAPAPAITFTEISGKPLALSDLRGKLVLVNFWATWCAPCMDELPLLVKAQKQFGSRGLQVVGPAMDDADAVKKLVAKLGINYPVSADYAQADQAMRAIGGNPQGGLPFSVFIDAQGKVVKTVLGGLHEVELLRDIEANLPK